MPEVLLVALATFLLNIPFGYWRESCIKFSWQWFVAVHAAVPFVILFRWWAGIEWWLPVIIFLVACYFAGQFAGSRLHRRIVTTLMVRSGSGSDDD